MRCPIKYAGGVIILFSLLTCDVINPEEDQPSYIYIPEIQVKTNYSTQGAASDQISDGWVFVGGDIIGIYELPAKIPVLKQDTQKVLVRAGIKQNGISHTRKRYPFYRVYEGVQELEAFRTDTIRPVVRYFGDSVINFAWKEDFSSGISLQESSNSEPIERVRNNDYPYSHGWVGHVKLTKSENQFEAQTINQFQVSKLDRPGQSVYLEVDYKGETDLKVGIVNQGQTNYKVGIRKGKWRKVYVSLTDIVRKAGGQFGITLKATTDTTTQIYFDNIKLLYFSKL